LSQLQTAQASPLWVKFRIAIVMSALPR